MQKLSKLTIVIGLVITFGVGGFYIYRYSQQYKKIQTFDPSKLLREQTNTINQDEKEIRGARGEIVSFENFKLIIKTRERGEIYKLTNNTKIKKENDNRSSYEEVDESYLNQGIDVLVLYNVKTLEIQEIDIIEK